MRAWGKLLLVLAGLALMGIMGWQVLVFEPFDALPKVVLVTGDHQLARKGSRSGRLEVQAQEQASRWMRAVSEGISTPPLTETTNIMLAGIDTRPWQHGGRTDALVVLVLDNKSSHVGLISIPRDLLVAVPGSEPNRINSVFATGLRQGGAEQGVALLRKVIRHTLGLPLAHVVFVEHGGFESLVDALGGITLQVVCPIRDRFLDPRGPGGHLELSLEAGVQHVDGRTALMFARSRHGRGIFDRARRQQGVLLALWSRILALGQDRVAELVPRLRDTVFTDLSVLDLLSQLSRLPRIKKEHLHGLVLGPEHAEPTVLPDGRWVLIPRPEAMATALSELFRARTPGFRRAGPCPHLPFFGR